MAICDNDFDVNCDTCYEVSRADDDLTFVYGLTALTQYYLQIMDIDRNVFTVLFTSGADGSFTIDPTDTTYPTGMFNKYAGDFEVWISNDADGTDVVAMTVYGTSYNCVLLTITSDSQTSCDTPTRPGCSPAYITDGVNDVEVASGDTYVCGTSATLNLVIKVDGDEQYNQVVNAVDNNTVNIQ